MKCPNCQSEDVQNIRVVYESGTSTVSGKAATVGAAWVPGSGRCGYFGEIRP
jgi:hypothetical protein